MRQPGPVLVGRAEDRKLLLDSVGVGLSGHPRALLVHGEAGVGKTMLVRSACEQWMADGVQVLWGQCLRFGAADAMYHPLVLALEAWLRRATVGQREDLLLAVPSAALLLPSLGAPPTSTSAGLMTVVDAIIQHLVKQGPTVVVVDDVQWADQATWDALTYVVAGFADQRLALLTTHRDEGVVSEGFARLLGNLRRLPGIEVLALNRLDEEQTQAQVASLLGRAADPRVAAEVFAQSRGNPYLSELLVARVDPASVELPAHLPDELSRALLEAWQGLSPAAREVTRILAVGGRPTEVHLLAAIAGDLGLEPAGAVREAHERGVVVLDGEIAWFRHPLLATVLVDSYLPGEPEPVHAAWARHLESTPSEGVDELRRLGDIALHQERSGDGRAAFAHLVAGADLAEALGAPREAADMLVRAAGLWDTAADGADPFAQARLSERAADACARVGRESEAIRMMTEARDLVDPDVDPLYAAHLCQRAAMSGWSREENLEVTIAALEQALELTRAAPHSLEHAEVLCAYADVLSWQGRTQEAWKAVEASMGAAGASRSSAAIARALGMRALLLIPRDLSQAEEDAIACWQLAVASGDGWTVAQAFNVTWNVAEQSGDLHRLYDWTRQQFEWHVAHGQLLWPSCDLARVSLDLGDLRTAEGAIRTGLAATGSLGLEAEIRILAGLLAARRGQHAEARDHLARARELMPYLDERPMQVSAARHANLLVELDETQAAFEFVERVLPINAGDSRVLDALLVCGARAAAELVQQAKDARDHASVLSHRKALHRLVAAREALGVPFEMSSPGDAQQAARASLFALELARAQMGVAPDLCRQAAQACGKAAMEWEQRESQVRLASALIESGAPGREVLGLLREVLAYADSQGARRLNHAVEELAATARVSLHTPTLSASPAVPAAFNGLTPREAEVLGHLVANRTYGEIAQELFISEKTVSTHVSHLLRKTGTVSRREVTALARRVGWAPVDERSPVPPR